MSHTQKELLEQARQLYGKIYKVAHRKTWRECFTCEYGYLIFWFNTRDHSTHVLKERV